jgi:excisionase family DNA binding protein
MRRSRHGERRTGWVTLLEPPSTGAIPMRGLGDFQRSQMKNNDPQETEFFRCLRNAVDMLEQIVLRPSSPAAEQQPERSAEKPKQTVAPEALKPERLAYRVNEAVKLLGLSRGTVYKLIQDEELPVIRLGRRVLIPAVALQALLETSRKSRS